MFSFYRLSVLILGCIFFANNAFAVITINFNIIPTACGNSLGAVSSQVTGGTGGYIFQWSNGEITSGISGVSAGSYTLTVTDMLGESASATAVVTDNPQLEYISQPYPSVGDSANGKLELNILNGAFPFTISGGCPPWNLPPVNWNPFEIYSLEGYGPAFTPASGCQPVINGISYTLTVTDANGCSVTVEETVGATGIYSSPLTSGSCGSFGTGVISDTLVLDDGNFIFQAAAVLVHLRSIATGNIIDSVIVPGSEMVNGMTYSLDSVPAGDYILEYHLEDLYTFSPDTFLLAIFKSDTVNVEDFGPLCGTVSGYVYVDANSNCVFDAGETPLTNTMVQVQPGDYVTMTDSTGFYTLSVDAGTFTITHNPQGGSAYAPVCPPSFSTGFVISEPFQQLTFNFADSLLGTDLLCDVFFSKLQSGSPATITASLINRSVQNAVNDTIEIVYDPQLVIDSISPVPFSVAPGTVRFISNTIFGFSGAKFQLHFTVPSDTSLINTPLWATSKLISGNDNVLSNNYDSTARLIEAVTGDFVKSVFPMGFSEGNYLPKQENELDYLIEFINTGQDSVMTLSVHDSFPIALDLLTFQPLASSHPYSYTLENRTIIFNFENIGLTALNADSINSLGYIAFRIHTRDTPVAGTQILNSATLNFDQDPAVSTDTSLLTIYDCDSIFTSLPLTIIACEQSTILIGATTVMECPISWSLNGTVLDVGPQIVIPNIVAGQHQVIAEAITPYCSKTQTYEVNATLLPVVNVTVSGDTLHCDPTGTTYQWYLNNVMIPGATDPDYIATVSGNYSVMVTNLIGCQNTSVLIYVSITGLESVHGNSLLVYPNPGKDEINIQLPENISGKTTVHVYSPDGRMVRNFSHQHGMKITILANDLEQGMYLIVLINGDSRYSSRWIRQEF